MKGFGAPLPPDPCGSGAPAAPRCPGRTVGPGPRRAAHSRPVCSSRAPGRCGGSSSMPRLLRPQPPALVGEELGRASSVARRLASPARAVIAASRRRDSGVPHATFRSLAADVSSWRPASSLASSIASNSGILLRSWPKRSLYTANLETRLLVFRLLATIASTAAASSSTTTVSLFCAIPRSFLVPCRGPPAAACNAPHPYVLPSFPPVLSCAEVFGGGCGCRAAAAGPRRPAAGCRLLRNGAGSARRAARPSARSGPCGRPRGRRTSDAELIPKCSMESGIDRGGRSFSVTQLVPAYADDAIRCSWSVRIKHKGLRALYERGPVLRSQL